MPVECFGLPPAPLPGADFHPIRHFEAWRERLEQFRRERPHGVVLRQTVSRLIAPFLPPEVSVADYATAEQFLNDERVSTATGRAWTRENLRMFLKPVLEPGSSPKSEEG